MTSQEFRKNCIDWLGSQGYKNIYSSNHPSDIKDNIDFKKPNYPFRIRCFLTENGIHYQLSAEIFDNECIITIQSTIFFTRKKLKNNIKIFYQYCRIIKIFNKIRKFFRLKKA